MLPSCLEIQAHLLFFWDIAVSDITSTACIQSEKCSTVCRTDPLIFVAVGKFITIFTSGSLEGMLYTWLFV